MNVAILCYIVFVFRNENMNTNLEMTSNELPVLPDVFSYCLENQKFRERWQDIYKSADEHIRDTRLYCKELFDSENW